MKKLLTLFFIVAVCYISTGFGGCQSFAIRVANAIGSVGSGENADVDNAVSFKYTIYVGDNGSIMRSTGENELSFEQKVSGTTQNLNNVKVTFQRGGNGNVVAVGNNGTIVRSTNMGNTWSVIPPVTTANMYAVDFNFYNYAVGDNGTLLMSTTGDVWSIVPVGTTRNLRAIGINPVSGGIVIAAGEKGTILRSSNSGFNWVNVSIPDTTVNFTDISKHGLYFNSNFFCLIGTGGKIFKSTDLGVTWIQKTSGTTSDLKSIYFHTADSVVVAGDNGTIKVSSNGGESWFTDANLNSPPGRNFKSVSIINRFKSTYSAVSDSIFYISNESITVGIEPVSSAIPAKIYLYQNYPNPFNPQTKIKIQLTELSDIRLVVFDIRGKEIGKLVDEKLNAGSYEVNFNGSKYPSGIYFYKLITAGTEVTKKMMLIK